MTELRFVPQTDLEIWQQYQDGKSLRTLGTIYNCAPDTIKTAICRAGGKTRPRRLLAPKDDRELRERYQNERLSTTELARAYGHTDRTIARAICRAGGAMRSIDERYKKFPKSKRREMAIQYQEGKTAAQIASEYDCCAKIVYNAVRECGYRVRGTGESREVRHVFKEGVEGKLCHVCGEWKALLEFYRARANSDGLCHQCIDCARQLTSDWRKANPEIVAESKYKRRCNEKACTVESGLDLMVIFESYGYHCAYCGRSDVELTLDHIVPVVEGGAHTTNNLVPACRSCNSSKRDSSLLVWLLKGGPLTWRRCGIKSAA